MFFSKKETLKHEISFFYIEEDFMHYDWLEYIDVFLYTISLFEKEEASFNQEVAEVFARISDVITKKYVVHHWIKGAFVEIRYGINKEILHQQIDMYKGWDETELYCFSEDFEVNLEEESCNIYFMIDMLHADMTIKCNDRDTYEKIKFCMINTLEKMKYCVSKLEVH